MAIKKLSKTRLRAISALLSCVETYYEDYMKKYSSQSENDYYKMSGCIFTLYWMDIITQSEYNWLYEYNHAMSAALRDAKNVRLPQSS